MLLIYTHIHSHVYYEHFVTMLNIQTTRLKNDIKLLNLDNSFITNPDQNIGDNIELGKRA